MAMLSQGVPLIGIGCPAGACREQERRQPRPDWRSLLGGFAAGVMAVTAFVAIAGFRSEAGARPQSAAREAAAGEWAAQVQAQMPRELPPEWRWEIKPVRLDSMFRKQR